MISRDLALGLFVGGTIGIIICAILNIWNAIGMAPLVGISILDIVLLIDRFIHEYVSRCKKYNKENKN